MNRTDGIDTVSSERNSEDTLCRLCMKNNDYYYNIFTSNVVCRATVKDVLNGLLGLEVAVGDGLPATLCPLCLNKLMEFSVFKKTCLESDTKLRKISASNYLRSIQREAAANDNLGSSADNETKDCIQDVIEGNSHLTCSVRTTEIYIPVPDSQQPRANMLFTLKEEKEDSISEGSYPVMHTPDPAEISNDASDPSATDDLSGTGPCGSPSVNADQICSEDDWGYVHNDSAHGGTNELKPQASYQARRTKRKRKATDDFQEYFNSHQIRVRPVTMETTDTQETEKIESEMTKRTSKSESEMVTMKLEDLRGILEEITKKKQEDIQKEVKEVVAEMFEEYKPKLMEELSKKSLNTTCYGHCCDRGTKGNNPATDKEEKVHLGSGIFCSELAYNSMQTAEEDWNWAISLLIGVFGEEDSKKMRVYPRKKGLIPFSLTFLTVAKAMYRERLIKMGKFAANDKALEQKVKKLPSYLSDRSLDLNGPRRTTITSATKQ